MFTEEFYPTPPHVIGLMLDGETIEGKTILEPQAGKGDIVDYLLNHQAGQILAVEPHPDLRTILAGKCQLIGSDFMNTSSEDISHVQLIVMNPPFGADIKHINHAFTIAPPGCRIISLCNYASYTNEWKRDRLEIRTLVEQYGSVENLGACFRRAERETDTEIALVKLLKPGGSYEQEFEGFFLEEEQEEQANGIMPYNVIRDLVNRYVHAIQIFDDQLATAVRLEEMIGQFFKSIIAFQLNVNGIPVKRSEFKKELQKSGWLNIFSKLNMEKYATKGLREDINKFVEIQTTIPFTMRNIYRMLEIVIGTNTQRMNKALLEVFDQLTKHHHENRHYVQGWKSNSHYLVGKKFVVPYMCEQERYNKGPKIDCNYRGNWDFLEDLVKALCYISGDRYECMGRLNDWIKHPFKLITAQDVFFFYRIENYDGLAARAEALYQGGIAFTQLHHQPVYGEWFDWAYFRVKAHKKGTMHFEFKDKDLWNRFNQRIAHLKGYPLFEGKEQTNYQKRNASYTEAA